MKCDPYPAEVARRTLTLIVALVGLSLAAPAAEASFHLVLVREVYPGSAANPGSEYVELQMYSGGQEFIAGHEVETYGPTGTLLATSAFAADVANGASQSTVVMATAAAEVEFGIDADAGFAPASQLDPAGGAICWENLDCVSWGTFKGSLPSPVGAPAAPAGIPDGSALQRTVQPGCPTRLEPSDDRNDSALDFGPVAPAPRPNSVPPIEQACAGSGGGGGDGGGSKAGGVPQTLLKGKPAKRGRDRTPTFRFRADEAGAKFECKLDRRAFRPCSSPLTTKRLGFGAHTFAVRARRPGGPRDPSPATYSFRILPPA